MQIVIMLSASAFTINSILQPLLRTNEALHQHQRHDDKDDFYAREQAKHERPRKGNGQEQYRIPHPALRKSGANTPCVEIAAGTPKHKSDCASKMATTPAMTQRDTSALATSRPIACAGGMGRLYVNATCAL